MYSPAPPGAEQLADGGALFRRGLFTLPREGGRGGGEALLSNCCGLNGTKATSTGPCVALCDMLCGTRLELCGKPWGMSGLDNECDPHPPHSRSFGRGAHSTAEVAVGFCASGDSEVALREVSGVRCGLHRVTAWLINVLAHAPSVSTAAALPAAGGREGSCGCCGRRGDGGSGSGGAGGCSGGVAGGAGVGGASGAGEGMSSRGDA